MRRSLAVGLLVTLGLSAMGAGGCGARSQLGSGSRGDASGACSSPPWILFDYADGAAGYGIWAMHPDGSSAHALDLGARAFQPAISPDGKSLLYLTTSNGDDESLVVRDLASQSTRTIAQGSIKPPSAGLGKAAVSPDSAWVAYGHSPNLDLVAFDGSGDHVLVSGPYEAGCCSWSYGHPAFSPDGATVYFSTVGRLESIGVDGSARTLLEEDQFFTNPLIPPTVFPNVSLSPDGTKLVAQVGCDVSELRIYPIAALPGDACGTGTKLVEVHTAHATNEASNASWGPGNVIAYDDVKDLFLIDAAGGAPTNLTSSLTTADASFAADPVWVSGCAALP